MQGVSTRPQKYRHSHATKRESPLALFLLPESSNLTRIYTLSETLRARIYFVGRIPNRTHHIPARIHPHPRTYAFSSKLVRILPECEALHIPVTCDAYYTGVDPLLLPTGISYMHLSMHRAAHPPFLRYHFLRNNC